MREGFRNGCAVCLFAINVWVDSVFIPVMIFISMLVYLFQQDFKEQWNIELAFTDDSQRLKIFKSTVSRAANFFMTHLRARQQYFELGRVGPERKTFRCGTITGNSQLVYQKIPDFKAYKMERKKFHCNIYTNH